MLSVKDQMQIMGIVNVTPDSFSDGGRYFDHKEAISHGIELFESGASIVDVGGESTRPFSDEIDEEEELRRVIPVISALSAYGSISVDTRHADVALRAVENGATIINDIGGQLAPVAAETGAAWVAMHMKGDPKTMQIDPHYDDVVSEVHDALESMVLEARSLGVKQVIVDPGIGFGKLAIHNLKLLREIARFKDLGCRILVGTSRKRFLAKLPHLEVSEPPPLEREEQGLGTEAWCLMQGVSIMRVHDTRKTKLLCDLVDRSASAYAKIYS